MHDRLDCYDDRALTEHELRRLRWEAAAGPEFRPWWGYCIDGEGTSVIKAGHRYQVIGEVLHHIDGRSLDKSDERWLVAGISNELTESGSGGEVSKSRIMPECEYLGWRVTGLQRQIVRLTAELDALGVPRVNSGVYSEGFRWDVDNYPTQQTLDWNHEKRTFEPCDKTRRWNSAEQQYEPFKAL